MNEFKIEQSSPEKKKRAGYIEGRHDLFETKLLRISSRDSVESEKKESLLAVARDPGSGNALLPVLKELSLNNKIGLQVLVDGRAEEIIRNNFKTERKESGKLSPSLDKQIEDPRVIIMDHSASEMGLETYVAANFPESPKVLVEDYYENSLNLLNELKKRKLSLPDAICVIDSGARSIIIKNFPELEERINVTGQPAFDEITKEDTLKIQLEIKKKLGIEPEEKLISFMSAMDKIEKIQQMADALKEFASNFCFAFRCHPRDNISYETYEKIFLDKGIKIINTNKFSVDEIGAASDLVITAWSTEGLKAIYRRKPTVHISDRFFNRTCIGPEMPLPPVKLGASVGIYNIHEIKNFLAELLDSSSDLNKKLKVNMLENYPTDGKNTQRVIDVVSRYLM